ncbi:MAG: glycosyl transferase family 2 [Haloarculaceae archaeon]
MEYVQDRVATLHDFGDADPTFPADRTTVVVPITEREHASPAADHVFQTLAAVDPASTVVALRARESTVAEVVEWIRSFDLGAEILWCTAPGVESLLTDAGLGGPPGKGRDVWLGLGRALEGGFVVVHDADAGTYNERHVPKLAAPLTGDRAFVKGYYARVEDDRLYGRLFRLFYVPLVRALADRVDDPIVDFLGAFRYALAGEFAMTADLAGRVRAQRDWGFEVGTLGEVYGIAGFEGTAQVDLGVHEHAHRPVEGSTGLGDMCFEVADAVFRSLADAGVEPDYEGLRAAYQSRARNLLEQYAADAAFNDFDYDIEAEREQVATYADAIRPPPEDRRLPAWEDAPIEPAAVRRRSAAALDALRDAGPGAAGPGGSAGSQSPPPSTER